MTSASALPPRVHGNAVMDVRFGVCYGELNERFWSHFDTALTLLQITAGALALAGVFARGGWLTALAGIALAGISGLQIGLKPRERSIAFRDTRRNFHDLDIESASLDLPALDRRLESLRRDAPRGMSSFLRPAEDRVRREHGYPGVELTTWQRFLCVLA
ncbi:MULTISPECIES: hypothetical protein [unclassified Variovorax]|uniref:hypothetical protein n=1 Tax=unclassified Variovorax TaxID=663243 RepID=UPI00076DA8B8|nr:MULTISPECIES: hypothetical protein [unclassified Variovorax]KWT83886.1 hypothetical protein APY03_4441 [Variovorax sp. WDL1]PNG46569.1 hypothetical protein CHC06_06912 [Variovorax sp. B2]PNG47609.1 hypothetical protein CHC07_06775 [Variovorax sp. B4]VTV14337.1 hypothetical protein WDL1CHR_04885 [Variovorax sp. WDL1]